jgi:hypothetical protein
MATKVSGFHHRMVKKTNPDTKIISLKVSLKPKMDDYHEWKQKRRYYSKSDKDTQIRY